MRRVRQVRGFTMIELIVVVAVIAILMAILLPAVNGAIRRGRKTDEMNRIRQVGLAWTMYAGSNQDAALPGFISDDIGGGQTVFDVWRIHHRFPNEESIPEDLVEEWPWRLLPYMDYDQATIHGHLDLTDMGRLTISDQSAALEVPASDLEPSRPRLTRARHVSLEPGFGYNAYYIGGVWGMENFGGEWSPRYEFFLARASDDVLGPPIGCVARSIASIRDTAGMVTFCSSSRVGLGVHSEFDDDRPGSHLAVPPILALDVLWSRSTTDSMIEVFELQESTSDPSLPYATGSTSVPIGRYTGQVAVLFADLHTDPRSPGSLDDQRLWVNTADKANYTHYP